MKKGKKSKTELVFDPEKRKEFLTGFRKRKEARKKQAKIALEKRVKNEIKRIRSQAKDDIKRRYQSMEPIKFAQADENVSGSDAEEELEDDDVKITIKPLSMDDMAEKHNWIGRNKQQFQQQADQEQEPTPALVDDPNRIKGMALEGEEAEEGTSEAGRFVRLPASQQQQQQINGGKPFESKKDIDRAMKKETLKALKKNKTFKAKVRAERSKNIKKSRRKEHFKKKFVQKHSKRPHK